MRDSARQLLATFEVAKKNQNRGRAISPKIQLYRRPYIGSFVKPLRELIVILAIERRDEHKCRCSYDDICFIYLVSYLAPINGVLKQLHKYCLTMTDPRIFDLWLSELARVS